METYPHAFPCPRIDPYGWEVDMGLIRTKMDGGYSRQRRTTNVMPHDFALEFMVPLIQLRDWQYWVDAYAYEYFNLPLISWMSSPTSGPTLHSARFTSNLEITLEDKKIVRVRVRCELGPIPPTDVRISAGTPANPSPDWIIAGSPAAPSHDIIRGGRA